MKAIEALLPPFFVFNPMKTRRTPLAVCQGEHGCGQNLNTCSHLNLSCLCCVCVPESDVLWEILQIQFWPTRDRTHDRSCTCTVIFISRPQLLHITTVGFHKAKARMNPPANSHRRTESVWGGWEPTGMQRWLRMQCTAIYIYIYIYRIYTKQQ